MPTRMTRREVLKGGMAFAGLAAMGIPEWALPALAQGEEVVPFLDIPEGFTTNPRPGVRYLDTRTIQSFLTPADQFFTVQHYGQPIVDPSTYKLKVTGLIERPIELSLDELKKRPRTEHVAGFECSGNSKARINGLVGNARWVGASLSALLKDCAVKPQGKEVVFFGADKGKEEITHGGVTTKDVEQNFARSLAIEDAMRPEILIAYAMNGGPLSKDQGFPVRLIVPGWYGVSNVKWLQHIHVQDVRFMGKFMARDYVTLWGRKVGDEMVWTETSVSKIRLKSMVARVTRTGNRVKIVGFALTDGTPLKAVEVRIDNGSWHPATFEKGNTAYSWKLFTHNWDGATPGEHMIVSRAIDVNGNVQPVEEDLELKKTRWENNGQFPRKVMIS